jgi:hypothetical protein
VLAGDVLVAGGRVEAVRLRVAVGLGVLVGAEVAVGVGVGVGVGVDVRVGVGVAVGVRVGVGVGDGVRDGVSVGIHSRRPGTSVTTSRAVWTTERGRRFRNEWLSFGTAQKPKRRPTTTTAPSKIGRSHSALSGSPQAGQISRLRLLTVLQLRHRMVRPTHCGLPQLGHTTCSSRISDPQRLHLRRVRSPQSKPDSLEQTRPIQRWQRVHQVLPGDQKHECDQQRHADEVHQPLLGRIDAPAADSFDDDKEDAAAV